MPRLTTSNPKYRKHRASGQAVVTVDGRDVYLGPHGTAASRRAYDRAVAEWLAAGRGSDRGRSRGGGDTTVTELVAGFWRHARTAHASASGHRGELGSYRLALRIVKRLYGPTPAADFGPLALKACRTAMVKAGWSRGYVNGQVRRLVRAFKWGVANELIPADVLAALRSVEGLRAGKCDARETEPVRPVDAARVDAVLAIAPPPVAAMISLQVLTGMRPGELCQMRPADVDRSGAVWSYTPATHKTQHRGHARTVYLGQRCQDVLLPFLDGRDPAAPCFSPAESMAWVRAGRTAARTTPASCGNRPGTHVARRPKRAAGTRYTTGSYGRAIDNLADRAFPPPGDLAKRPKETDAAWAARLTAEQTAELADWRRAHRWHPHQLRHNFATAVRRTHGLDVAQVLLGHRSVSITQVYAERDVGRAVEVVKAIG